MRSFISAVLVGVVMVSLLVVPVACNSGAGLLKWFTSQNTAIPTVAAVAADISAYLNSEAAQNATNAQVLAKISSLIPNAYAQSFSAIMLALQKAATDDETPEAATKAVKRDLASGRAVISSELLQYLKQQAEMVRDENK